MVENLVLTNSIRELLKLELPDDPGGRWALSGLLYQYLYSLRLMGRVLNGEIDSYLCEKAEDFLAVKMGADGRPVLLELIEVKSGLNGLRTKKATEAFQKLDKQAREVRARQPDCQIRCRFVYNGTGGVATRRRLVQICNQVTWAPDCPCEIEAFISPELLQEEVIAEMNRLFGRYHEIIALLHESSDYRLFFGTILGLTVPYHSSRCVSNLPQWFDLSGALLGLPGLGAAEVREVLRQTLEQLQSIKAKRLIQRTEQVYSGPVPGLLRRRIPEGASVSPEWWDFGDLTSMRRHLALVFPLFGNGYEPSFAPSRQIVQFKNRYALQLDHAGLIRVDSFLSERKLKVATHHERMKLVKSFLEAVRSWSQKGVVLQDNFAEHHRRWYVRETDAGPQFVCSGFPGLALYDVEASLLDPNWISTRPLAGAICQLYGQCKLSKRGEFRQLPWGGNGAIADFIDCLLASPFVDANKLLDMIDAPFASERHWPIFISAIDNVFARDALNLNEFTPEDLLLKSTPRTWHCDYGREHSEIIYLNCSFRGPFRVQIGLIPDESGSFIAHRVYRYGEQRWSAHQDHDQKMGVPFAAPRKEADFVLLGPQEDWGKISWRSFGIYAPDWKNWVLSSKERLKENASKKRGGDVEIEHEQRLHDIKRITRDEFSRRQHRCEVKVTPHATSVETDLTSLLRHAEICGVRREELDGMSISIQDADENCLKGKAWITYDSKGIPRGVTVTHENEEENFIPTGPSLMRLLDRGADAVISTEQSLFNSFWRDLAGPARQAWRFLSELRFQMLPLPRLAERSWGEGYEEVRETTLSEEPQIVSNLMDRFAQGTGWQIVHGAPGTGKTRVAAQLAGRYLEQYSQRTFPPCRVLVIANTNWAIENFLATFQQIHGDRFLVHQAAASSYRIRIEDDEKRRQSLEQLEARFQSVISQSLPKSEVAALAKENSLQLRKRLEEHLNTDGLQANQPGDHEVPYVTPSFRDWLENVRLPKIRLRHHLHCASQAIGHAIQSMEGYQLANSEGFGSSKDSVASGAALFAADLVGSTVDGLRQLPDMGFDLVIFEEASQLSLTAMLKVMWQVIRGSHDRSNRHVLLSGDPRQLPPHPNPLPDVIRNNPAHDRLAGAYERAATKPYFFDRICSNNSNRVHVLTRQHRMHPEIAGLVNNLFYRDQVWTCSGTSLGEPAVFWVDPTHFPGKRDFGGAGGKSRFADDEADLVQELHEVLWRPEKRFLAITPYKAQQRNIWRRLNGRAQVCTVDSCQGIEADTVVVSFVDFRGFLSEPERLNVALSRARRRLYLVGRIKDLREAARRIDRPHLRFLTNLFSSSGHFGQRVFIPYPQLVKQHERLFP